MLAGSRSPARPPVRDDGGLLLLWTTALDWTALRGRCEG